MTIIVIGFLYSIIAAIMNSEMDTILFRNNDAWFNSHWWRKYNLAKNWWTKVPFSFLADGWHFCKAVQEYSYAFIFSLMVVSVYDIFWLWAYLIAIPIYTLRGIIWEIFYKLKNEFSFLKKEKTAAATQSACTHSYPDGSSAIVTAVTISSCDICGAEF